jgi:glycosyltransferase involved in cell wall biosynthesis
MKKEPTVTIGLCVKNAERIIADAIDSIAKQNYPHDLMELIVVDGDSKDGTLDIIRERLSTTDIEHSFYFENEGLGLARQIVVRNARGKYVIWVDADLIFPANYVSLQVRFMEANPKVGIGRARYGILPESSIVAFLENIPFVVECYRHTNDVPLGISGTEGAINKTEAVREAGGFDIRIKGAAEDTDLAYRIKLKGWSVRLTEAVFYEKCRDSFKALWDEYVWWGRGGHYSFHKRKDVMELVKMSPPAGFLAGALRLPIAFKLTHRASVFLLPLHYAFKRVAWCIGYFAAHLNGYGHSS